MNLPSDVGPNERLSKVFALLMIALGLCFFVFAYDVTGYVRSEHWRFPVVPAAIGVVFFAIAWRSWGRPPKNTALISFRSGGFRLETRQVFRGEKTFELDWANIREVARIDNGLYGGRVLCITYGEKGETAMFHAMWTDTDTNEIVKRFQTSANAAGFQLKKKKTGFFRSLARDRWAVSRCTS